MNKKLLALAVSAAIMAPVAAQAESSFYGRVDNALDFKSPDESDSTTDLNSFSSRFGFKGSSDLGNGLTASARYEFSMTTDKEQNNINDLRLGFVSIAGNFGSITAGNQWSSFYDTFGTLMSQSYSIGYFLYSSVMGGAFRTSNTIKYANYMAISEPGCSPECHSHFPCPLRTGTTSGR